MDTHSTISPAVPENAGLSSEARSRSLSETVQILILGTTEPLLAETARHDLQASLQLLANRMQYLTQASAATIGLRQGGELLCQASAGPMATELGAPLRADSGLINQSIIAEQIFCCNNTRNAISSQGTSYRGLGIKAIMVMPLIRESEVIGVLELLADRTNAFDDEDGEALEHSAEMILTALTHADAAKRAEIEIAGAREIEISSEIVSAPENGVEEAHPEARPTPATPKVHNCEACGFPVSDGRKLCLDCEEAGTREDENATPGFLARLAHEQRQGWLEANFYTIGTVMMIVLTVVVLVLKFR